MNLDNENERVEHILKRLRLRKLPASQQYYNDLIYNYYKKEIKPVAYESKQKIMRLFDDEPEDIFVDLSVIPMSYVADYCNSCPGEFSTLLQPTSFKVDKLVGQAAHIAIDVSEYVKNAFVTADVDFATALSKCLLSEVSGGIEGTISQGVMT